MKKLHQMFSVFGWGESKTAFSFRLLLSHNMDDLDARQKSTSNQPPKANVTGDLRHNFSNLVFDAQKRFSEEIEELDKSGFEIHHWETQNGSGRTLILEKNDGEDNLFEKVGISASISSGLLPVSMQFLLNSTITPVLSNDAEFFTVGLSVFTYHKNPHIPTLNFSFRYFQICRRDEIVWWFGGNVALIPYILHMDDYDFFHNFLKTCCDKHNKSYYKAFKKNCDEHYYLEHRGETLGIGGLFFEKLNFPSQKTCSEFVTEFLQTFSDCYMKYIVLRNRDRKHNYHDRQWKLQRQGRLVEFYLNCDKSTAFSLLIPEVEHENILISLPPSVKWEYDYHPEENSKEYELLEILRNPREWS